MTLFGEQVRIVTRVMSSGSLFLLLACGCYSPSRVVKYAPMRHQPAPGDSTPPRIVILEPQGDAGTRTITVSADQVLSIKGMVWDDSNSPRLTLDGKPIDLLAGGTFTYQTRPELGMSSFHLVAPDSSGNQASAEITVNAIPHRPMDRQKVPPLIVAAKPAEGGKFNVPRVEVSGVIADDQAVSRTEYRLNGREAKQEAVRAIGVEAKPAAGSESRREVSFAFTVDLAEGTNQIEIAAWDNEGLEA